jgi:hypothetical protein
VSTSTGTGRDIVCLSTQSVGCFVTCSTSLWFTWVANEFLHIHGPTGALRQYANQGSFQDEVAKIFWVSLLDKYQILFVS